MRFLAFSDEDDDDDVDVDGDDNITDEKGVSTKRRKSVGDSPLDALFQMASKTFEGLKAKSGKIDRFYIKLDLD